MTARSVRSSRPRARLVLAVTAGLLVPLASLPPASSVPAATAGQTPAQAEGVVSRATVGGLQVENSFVSSVGWVKPGQAYPSRLLLTNTGDQPVSADVTITAPVGTTFTDARGGASVTEAGRTVTWSGDVPATDTTVLVLESTAATTDQLPSIVWRDISSTATVTVGSAAADVTSHGPKVIPPGEEFDTARYGDRPFPVVPVQYTDRDYQASHDRDLSTVINSPGFEGSTFNLYQEMSLGQLYPEGTVPSDGIDTADFGSYGPGFDFSTTEVGQTCTGVTFSDTPLEEEDTPLYPERITDGVYNLPGQTQWYGADANGSAVTGSLAGVGALQAIDSGCGPAGKLVRDAAAIADPEIDYSDYDTDKDGVVDFFMAVFAGCGGNGSSQLSVAGCPYTDAPYDNIWPHSSSLEFSYTDPETGLPGFTTDDQLKNLEGQPLWYTDEDRDEMTTTPGPDDLTVYVRVGPYNVNPETAIDKASVISHEYGHSLGLPDFYSTGSRETYGDWNLMATDKSHHIDAYGRQELGWVVPEVLDSSRTESGITDSKQDTDTLTWQTADGTPYTLTEGEDGRVQNSQMYVAKLPGRILLDPAKFESGDTATPVHTWWSRSGNDFGCAKDAGKGHNLDLALPEVADLPAGTELTLDLKSMWDVEWDYDYGFVLTSTDGGEEFAAQESAQGFTTPKEQNPNQNACQAFYGNGITGSSQSYADGTQDVDRLLGNYPEMSYQADSFDISELAGADLPVLRFSYATDPGLAKRGWFIDDVSVTATLPDGSTREIYATDFESSGDQGDPRIFNGGCRADGPGSTNCTQGWQYVAAGTEGRPTTRTTSRCATGPGSTRTARARTTATRSASTPASTTPTPTRPTATATPAPTTRPRSHRSTARRSPGRTPRTSTTRRGARPTAVHRLRRGPHRQLRRPGSPDGSWHFRYDCLAYDVTAMSGEGVGPATSDGDLTGRVDFTIGRGCGDYDYGYGEEAAPDGDTTAPAAALGSGPARLFTGTRYGSTAPRPPTTPPHHAGSPTSGTSTTTAGPTRPAGRSGPGSATPAGTRSRSR